MKIYHWTNVPKNYNDGQIWVVAESVESAREIALAYFADGSGQTGHDKNLQTIKDEAPEEIEVDPGSGFIMVDWGCDG